MSGGVAMGASWRPVVNDVVLIAETGVLAIVEEVLPDGTYWLVDIARRPGHDEVRTLDELRRTG